MTDRELLELAAKAAGINGEFDKFRGVFRLYIPGQDIFLGDDVWSPLSDDGDAFRLAVKMRLALCHHHEDSNPAITSTATVAFNGRFIEKDEAHGDDAEAATRRAIVRAAAEIGRAIP
jgi:hypothetical protein